VEKDLIVNLKPVLKKFMTIKPYLEKLLKQEREQANELLRAQIADYRSFVSELVSMGKIMSKQFFVVVPYDPLSNKKRGFWSRISEVAHPAVTVKLKEERFLDSVEEKEGNIIVKLSIFSKKPVLSNVTIVSKPGLRIYMNADELEKIKTPDIYILTTPKGVLSSKDAKKARVGGEVIAEIW